MGWWGDVVSGPDGAFAEPYQTPTLLSLTPKSVGTVGVVGNSARVEWPVDFALRLYDAEDNLLATRQVTGNSQVVAEGPYS